MRFDIVIPTVGRASLTTLLESLWRCEGPQPERVIVVDDRREAKVPLALAPMPPQFAARTQVLPSGGRGPAAARNVGWRTGTAPWVAFLDDDVVLTPRWLSDLADDLSACEERCAGSMGIVRVPLQSGRRPTDYERNVRALENARFITADCAYRRRALQRSGGFDERFKRAYREDLDLALRVLAAGATIARGRRVVLHPVREADCWVSVRLQAGNADDALMARLHGPRWRTRAGIPAGRFPRHVMTVGAAAASAVFAAAWLVQTAAFAYERLAPGPRNPREAGTMLLTSIVIPFAAVYHRIAGEWSARRALRRRAAAVLFDRDGTLVHDRPAPGDADAIEPVAGARTAVARLRAAGIPVGVISNQSAVGEGTLSAERLAAVNARIDEVVGPFAVWRCCTHARAATCDCRKPAPGLVRDAAHALGVAPSECVVIGDIGSDVAAAKAAGARAILVPNGVTKERELDEAPLLAPELGAAVDLVLAGLA